MAEVLAGWPDDDGYPWDQWTDGQVWSVTSGVDFQIEARKFQIYLYRVAERKNTVVTTKRPDPHTVVFQFRK